MDLPEPVLQGGLSVERAISERRTVRSFGSAFLNMSQVSRLMWSAQGITEKGGFKRAAPSAGALYPMDIYGAVGQDCVEGLKAGVYHYAVKGHSLFLIKEGDFRKDISRASLEQTWMARAPLILVITAEYDRVTVKYGKRGLRYAIMEAGHIGENIFLQCQSSGLAAGIVGAFDDQMINQVLGAKKTHEPLLIMPVGYES